MPWKRSVSPGRNTNQLAALFRTPDETSARGTSGTCPMMLYLNLGSEDGFVKRI
jgi:hypothetical protein